MRAPLAWGCETGLYSAVLPKVGVLEGRHDVSHPEYGPSVVRSWAPSDAALGNVAQLAQIDYDSLQSHSSAVVGLLASRGDNDTAMAGTVWRSGLFLYNTASPGRRQLDLGTGFFLISNEVVSDAVSILSISLSNRFAQGTTSSERQAAVQSL
jgi:hypothetical protein